MEMGGFSLRDKLALEINGNKTWIFHGDVFDHTTASAAKFWAHTGSLGLAILLGFNRFVNSCLKMMGYPKISLTRNIMNEFNKRIVKIHEFEQKIADVAFEKEYDTVICGHIHQPQSKVFEFENHQVRYLNSGDWVDHMTALEYYNGDWHLYKHDDEKAEAIQPVFKEASNFLPEQISFYLNTLNVSA